LPANNLPIAEIDFLENVAGREGFLALFFVCDVIRHPECGKKTLCAQASRVIG
jgi:hypothetical protein